MVNTSNSTNATAPINSTLQAWHDLQGHVIDKKYDAGYILLSFLVSLVGAWTAFELLNLRTTRKGRYNWTVLVFASIAMGGVAVWCMHFIGEEGIILGGGDPTLQISYNKSSISESFFLPVIVFFIAFWTVGSNETIDMPRVGLGGTLAGLGICGMHYLGQASISNYACFYNIVWVFISAFIGIAGSVGSIYLFFLWRSSWASCWSKKGICACLLAFSISGLHWLSSVGTHYHLHSRPTPPVSNPTEHFAIIVATVLTIVAALVNITLKLMLFTRRQESINSSQKLTLFAAIFDKHGNVLIGPQGCLPNRKITSSFIEGSLTEVFNTSHPIFLWIFRAAKNWHCVKDIIPAMRLNISAHIEKHNLRGREEVSLVDDDGDLIKDYSIVFRELFCIAAADLANDLRIPMEKLGPLYDDVIGTGQKIPLSAIIKSRVAIVSDLIEKTIGDIQHKIKGGRRAIRRPRKDVEKDAGAGTGQLLFLVKKVQRREAEALQAAGYRFGKIGQVLTLLSNTMKIKDETLTKHLSELWKFANQDEILDPGCHLACFAIRASVRGGFDIVVRKDAKSQLPTMTLPFESLEQWQMDFLTAMNTLNVTECQRFLAKAVKAKELPTREKTFSNQLLTTLQSLKYEIGDPIFSEACLISKPIEAPCRGASANHRPGVGILIAFRLMVPINTRRAPGKKCTFAPLTLFKLQQRVYKNSLDHSFFVRAIYREFSPIFAATFRDRSQDKRLLSQWRPARSGEEFKVEVVEEHDPFGNLITRIRPSRELQSRPTMERLRTLWDVSLGRSKDENSSGDRPKPIRAASYQSMGILVSTEVERDVKLSSDKKDNGKGRGFDAKQGNRGVTAVVTEDVEPLTFVDELFQICVKNTGMPH
ncbi:uncharacterized protein EAE98_003975 [Botrytis deweyae]|uniref:MHYT domain-containing protein n=1 Tax=Botrytis deweyae TaxID=2478750 RepID=A0ABQ7IS86_9HELO|nr:uncharacterized protein EAE98_003975 [Botrytis deweyae]KAF7932676.1 hypothetical protein EAE98_003975 [Botrytis deweyae]